MQKYCRISHYRKYTFATHVSLITAEDKLNHNKGDDTFDNIDDDVHSTSHITGQECVVRQSPNVIVTNKQRVITVQHLK